MNCVPFRGSAHLRPLHAVSDYAKPITEFNIEEFVFHNDETVRVAVQNLSERKATMTDKAFKDLEIIYGWNHNLSRLSPTSGFGSTPSHALCTTGRTCTCVRVSQIWNLGL